MISEDDLVELLNEDRIEQIAPEDCFCQGCGRLLEVDRDGDDAVFCVRCR